MIIMLAIPLNKDNKIQYIIQLREETEACLPAWFGILTLSLRSCMIVGVLFNPLCLSFLLLKCK